MTAMAILRRACVALACLVPSTGFSPSPFLHKQFRAVNEPLHQPSTAPCSPPRPVNTYSRHRTLPRVALFRGFRKALDAVLSKTEAEAEAAKQTRGGGEQREDDQFYGDPEQRRAEAVAGASGTDRGREGGGFGENGGAEHGKADTAGKAEGKQGSRYVPPEQWNHTVDVNFEERLRFEALRSGNRVRQNSILSDALNNGF